MLPPLIPLQAESVLSAGRTVRRILALRQADFVLRAKIGGGTKAPPCFDSFLSFKCYRPVGAIIDRPPMPNGIGKRTDDHQCKTEGPANRYSRHCEAAGRGNLLISRSDNESAKDQHRLLPPAFMRGVPEGRGESAAVRIRRSAAIEDRLYRLLPPVLRFAWTSPLINEGGKVECGGDRPYKGLSANEQRPPKGGRLRYFRESMAFLAALTAAGEAYWRSNSLAMGRPMGTPSRLNFMGPGSLALALRWKWHTPVSR